MKKYITIGVIILIFLNSCSSTGSTVKITRSVIPPKIYKYTVTETYKSRNHGLDGLYSVNTDIFYFDFYTTQLGWVDGKDVKVEHRPLDSIVTMDKRTAKFYFGKNKLIIKNLKNCDNITHECGELRINGEHKVDITK